jgi:ATP-dependent DNA helicase PIF1
VVPRASKAQIIEACLKTSRLWRCMQKFQLHMNMHVQWLLNIGGEQALTNAQNQQEFANWLKRIGEGQDCTYPIYGEEAILLPPQICCHGSDGNYQSASIQDLIKEVYGELQEIQDWNERSTYIIERAILSPLNADVDYINKLMCEHIKNPNGTPLNIHTYYSADSVIEHEQRDMLPVEFLNSLSFSGVPPHELPLFVGCPILLLNNMTGGLANGTRLIVTQLMQNVIEAKVATGPAKDETVFIP